LTTPDGADIILTNTYQSSVDGYMEYLELDEEQSIELIKNTVRLAHIAKERYLTECYQAQLSVQEGKLTSMRSSSGGINLDCGQVNDVVGSLLLILSLILYFIYSNIYQLYIPIYYF